MEYIRVSNENIDKEHICCAISNNNDIQVSSKKAWLQERFDEGLVFLKSKERGKCFIEYIPAENAWNPIVANSSDLSIQSLRQNLYISVPNSSIHFSISLASNVSPPLPVHPIFAMTLYVVHFFQKFFTGKCRGEVDYFYFRH